MSHSPSTSSREPWVDALRALALLGVFVVNAMGYPSAPSYPMPLGASIPVDSTVAIWLNGFLAIVFQGKAYPLLCFLFGYSLCCIARQTRGNIQSVKLRIKRRQFKLLLIGVLHGIFIYFGDVLTVYAICGLITGRWVNLKPVKLLRILKQLMILNIVLYIILVLGGFVMWVDGKSTDTQYAQNILENFISIKTYSQFFDLNFFSYLESLVSTLFLFPIFLCLTVAGVFVRRFNLFTMRKQARRFWSIHLTTGHFIFALILNICVGIFIAIEQSNASVYKLPAIVITSIPINIWLVAAAVAAGMRYWHKKQFLPAWVYWLAPAGKHTLAMYLFLSFALMLSGGVFFNFQVSSLFKLIVVICVWVCAINLAKLATQRNYRDPIARWLSGSR